MPVPQAIALINLVRRGSYSGPSGLMIQRNSEQGQFVSAKAVTAGAFDVNRSDGDLRLHTHKLIKRFCRRWDTSKPVGFQQGLIEITRFSLVLCPMSNTPEGQSSASG